MSNDTVQSVTNSLGNDVKNLASEYGAAYKKAIAAFFHHGLCNLKAIPQKFEELKGDIVNAVGKFKVKPLEEYWSYPDKLEEAIRENERYSLPKDQPIVTILSSQEPSLPMGMRLPLGDVNQRIERLDKELLASNSKAKTITFQIDYQQGKNPDRFAITQEIGNGDGNLIDRIQKNLSDFRTHPERLNTFLSDIPDSQKTPLKQFTQKQMDELEKKTIPYFSAHCKLFDLEQATKQVISKMNPGIETVKQIGQHNAILSYIDECRNQLNQSEEMAVLPIPPFNKQNLEQKEKEQQLTAEQQKPLSVKIKLHQKPIKKATVKKKVNPDKSR